MAATLTPDTAPPLPLPGTSAPRNKPLAHLATTATLVGILLIVIGAVLFLLPLAN